VDWSPFKVGQAQRARGLNGPDGLGDRLRTAAFAELQAAAAFRWAVQNIADAEPDLKEAWARFAVEEEKHYGWIMGRMKALGVEPAARDVSDSLWRSLTAFTTAREFCGAMSKAEDRGRQAERAFVTLLAGKDPESAAIFEKIAAEEDEHIARQKVL
jgi:uncharacterized ferritin-like protein (DUF455 family)